MRVFSHETKLEILTPPSGRDMIESDPGDDSIVPSAQSPLESLHQA